MGNPSTSSNRESGLQAEQETLHPAWRELMKLCASLGYGEIERLKIHDGLPVLAEMTRQKIKLN